MIKTSEIGKKLKISKAQQYMFGAVVGASIVLGVCVVIAVYFLKYIRFDTAVIKEKSSVIQGYSDSIKNIGVCKSPKGKTYQERELKNCTPNDYNPDDLPGTLRSNVLIEMAANEDLESVARNDLSICVDSKTGQRLSYQTLMRRYENSTNDEDRLKNYQIYTMCSALRAIPDALPSSKNEFALMASIDKIFKVSGWEPDSITPGEDAESLVDGLEAIGVYLTMDTSAETALRVLRNMERSIRSIDVNTLSLESYESGMSMILEGEAYYTDTAELNEGIVTVNGNGRVRRSLGGETE